MQSTRLGYRWQSARGAAICAAVTLLLVLPAVGARAEQAEFRFQREGILGTSLDLTVRAPDQSVADRACQAALAEIERLRLVLSTYDASSEISRLQAATGPVACSAELLEVLDLCESWRQRSGGAFNVRVGDLVTLWKQAERAGRLPDEAALAAAVARLSQPAYRLDRVAGTVAPVSGARLSVDALAKGYILEKSVLAARRAAPAVSGLLLDIGGDVRAWSRAASPAVPWTIGVADPRRPHDNAAPLVRLRLTDAAVATSGHYARFYEIGGRRYSHILDPRTGRPVETVTGATAVAADAATADALATALCVLTPEEGLKLVASVGGAEALIIGSDGRRHSTPGFAAMVVSEPAPAETAATASSAQSAQPAVWPAGWQLSVGITLAVRTERPYLAAWIEAPDGSPVKPLAMWGKNPKYQRKLISWWERLGQRTEAAAVTRASRPAGQYALAWDGRDAAGKPVPPGPYVVRVETITEHGPRLELRGQIECAARPARVEVPGNRDVTALVLDFGPPPKQ